MMTTETTDNPLRKVAILVASLDEDWSERVLSSLPSDQAAIVRQRVERLEDIDPEEQQAILTEFRRSLAEPLKSNTDGVELELSHQNRIQHTDYRPRESSISHTLNAFSGEDTSFIVEMLVGEHPQTIALVLSRLETQQAAEVLSKFSSPVQTEILERLSELDTIDEESVQVVESQLADWVAEQRRHKQRMSAGMKLVEQIMSKTPTTQREAMLAQFSEKGSALAGKLVKELPAAQAPNPRATYMKASLPRKLPEVRIESRPVPVAPPEEPVARNLYANHSAEQCLAAMEGIDTNTLLITLARCEPHVVSLALVGASDSLLKRVLRGLSRRESKMFRQSLREMGPTRLSDMLAAQQEILHIASNFNI